MIQNYVFFSEAKYQCNVNDNDREWYDLFEQAGEQLSHSVRNVAMLCVNNAANLNVAVENIFKQDENKSSLFSKLIKLFRLKDQEDQLKDEHRKFINSVITKLGKYRNIIGPSVLISGLIARYKDDILNEEIETAERNLRFTKRMSKTGTHLEYKKSIILFVIVAVIFLIVWGITAIFGEFPLVFAIICLSILSIFFIIQLIKAHKTAKEYASQLPKYQEEYDFVTKELPVQYNEIEDFYASLL